MCFHDLDEPEFFQRAVRTARTPHVCSERGCAIARGDRYEHVRGKWDGEILVFKICAACRAVRQAVADRELAAGCAASESDPGYGGLADALANYDADERAEILAAAAQGGTP